MKAIAVVEVAAQELHADRVRREHGGLPLPTLDVGKCSACNCTDQAACDGGCSWVKLDLCSRCAFEALDEPQREQLSADSRAVLLSTGIQAGCEWCARNDALPEFLVDPDGGFVCPQCAKGISIMEPSL